MDLRSFLRAAKITVSKMADDLKISQPTVTQWKNGIAIPNMSNMKKLMIYTQGLVMPNDFFTDFIEKRGFSK